MKTSTREFLLKYLGVFILLGLICLATTGFFVLRYILKNSMFVEVKCRDLKISTLNLFPDKINDTVTFVNSTGKIKMLFCIAKDINHTTKYISDTGCNCWDVLHTTYANASDTIDLRHDLQYIYDFPEKEYTAASISFDGRRGSFIEAMLDTTFHENKFEEKTHSRIHRYHNAIGSENNSLASALISDDAGLLQIKLTDGEYWQRQVPPAKNVSVEDFKYTEGECR